MGSVASRVHGAVAFAALALASPALSAPRPAQASVMPKESRAAAKKPDRPPEVEVERSESATRVATWIASSGDNGSLPYIIIDKNAAVLFVFNAKGKPLGEAPILIGVARGDDATPGVGNRNLSKIGPAERTTPAGRFLAEYGLAVGRQKVLWVDYATSVALHPVVTTNKKERRLARLRSADPEDNRVTFGCINVPNTFYQKNIRPRFRKDGGVVYILPDIKPLEEVFPRLRLQPFLNTGLQ